MDSLAIAEIRSKNAEHVRFVNGGTAFEFCAQGLMQLEPSTRFRDY